MGVTNSNKVINTQRIPCDGTLRVTLALTAAPDIASNPTDIVLVLDRSGSMAGAPLSDLKLGANVFIDLIDEATDGGKNGQIGGGSRIGIVSFSNVAIANTQLITSTAALKSAVDSLAADGSTNHADAFSKAMELFDPTSTNGKVMILFTDGNTTTNIPPAPVAAAARAQGIIIYCIGLIGSDGLDVSALNSWASEPYASHVAVTPEAADLEALFAELAAILSELDQAGVEHPRGMKTMTIPAHSAPTCRDVLVKCIKFVVPEDLNVSGPGICSPRRFQARFLANLIDTDFQCCGSAITFS